MPRAGGDYIFISRVLHPALGFAANFSFVMWLVVYIAVYGNWIATIGFAGFCGSMAVVTGDSAWTHAATTVSKEWFAVLTGTIFIFGIGGLIVSGVRPAMRVLVAMFYLAFGGLAITVISLLLTTRADFVHGLARLGTSYSRVISTAAAQGYTGEATNLHSTLLAVGVVALSLFFVMFTTYTGGEVQKVKRSVPFAMFGALLALGLAMVILAWLAGRDWGRSFIGASQTVASSKVYTLPASPSYSFFVTISAPNFITALGTLLLFVACSVANMIFLWLAISRVVFAYAFDRVIPQGLAEVNSRTGSPLRACVVVCVFAEVALLAYTVGNFTTFLVGSTLGLIATLFVVSIAAVAFPYRLKTVAERSPLNPRWMGVSAISIVGALSTVILGIIIYGFLTDSVYGANSTEAIAYFIGFVVAGLLLYLIGAGVRRAQGISIAAAFRELPPE
jgi:amino acid transporter